LIEAYFEILLHTISASPVVRTRNVTFDQRSSSIGFIRGDIYFIDGSLLHFRELINLQLTEERVMYAYHYQGTAQRLIFRYDNTAHFPNLPNAPHHKHMGEEQVIGVEGVIPSLGEILREIESLIEITTR
jgi:hypothetical protein